MANHFSNPTKATIKKSLAYIKWLDPHIDDIMHKCFDGEVCKKEEKCCPEIFEKAVCSIAQIVLKTPKDHQKDHKICEIIQKYIKKNNTLPPQHTWCNKAAKNTRRGKKEKKQKRRVVHPILTH